MSRAFQFGIVTPQLPSFEITLAFKKPSHSLSSLTFLTITMRLLGAVSVLATVVSGSVVSYTEAVSGVQYNVAIPETAAAPFDIYTSIVSPINMTWAAIAFGGCMLRSPILVAWANGTNIAVSPRWAT